MNQTLAFFGHDSGCSAVATLRNVTYIYLFIYPSQLKTGTSSKTPQPRVPDCKNSYLSIYSPPPPPHREEESTHSIHSPPNPPIPTPNLSQPPPPHLINPTAHSRSFTLSSPSTHPFRFHIQLQSTHPRSFSFPNLPPRPLRGSFHFPFVSENRMTD